MLIKHYSFELRDGPETKIEFCRGVLPHPRVTGEARACPCMCAASTSRGESVLRLWLLDSLLVLDVNEKLTRPVTLHQLSSTSITAMSTMFPSA